ncbi:glycogen synthase GlgA [Desulfuribacillus alkaliarsenatis]|uniref:Glycogen synthase n=1 Tax=Desulfuribacillus alkaliarsenatis TaxID=766136 RepID=A0A1E5G0M1_9FIRM|nr:glycogen synthase GlgA [Desulfuribacillus alkaliarsenatis]OEF96293.1 starch synthase [Desulfuribacillus alkaliarsenatis]
MNILMAASEAVPFAKTGGLADVVGSLPKELHSNKVNVRVILPKYGAISEEFVDKIQYKTSITVKVGWREQYCGIEELIYNGVHFYFIDNKYYFNRDKLYGFYDEAERFAFFSRAVLEAIPYLDYQPDVIHCHDWQTALISVFLKTQYSQKQLYENIKTVLTIHNLKFQGIYPREILGDLLSLGSEHFTSESLEFYGNVNYLKGGIIYSDIVTTVSKTYAEEITYSYFGENLEGVLRRQGRIIGIINGIDYELYNSSTDSQIFYQYDSTSPDKKLTNKEALQNYLGLPVDKDIPVLAIISRLTSQKGLDLVQGVFDELLAEGIQLVILGTGEEEYEQLFRKADEQYPNQVKALIKFDEGLARKVYAGSDMFLMPSKFEPCGLSQLISLRYGTIPIVRETGGLKDTIKGYDEISNTGNGFSFINYNAHDMLYTIQRAVSLYQDKKHWNKLIKNAMDSDFSWEAAAKEYLNLYSELIGGSAIDVNK